jgi:hypothetical protein
MARTCPRCGLLNPDDGRHCDCGHDFGASQPASAGFSPEYIGVDGWLLLLCVSLTILGPLGTLVGLVRSYSEAAQHFDDFPRWAIVFVLDSVLTLGLMGFGIRAGLGLWRVRPNAVPTAKVYLMCAVVYSAVAAILPSFTDLPSEVSREMFHDGLKQGLKLTVVAAIWFIYLSRSRRVRATYADEYEV